MQEIQVRATAWNYDGTLIVYKSSFVQNDADLQQIALWNVSGRGRHRIVGHQVRRGENQK